MKKSDLKALINECIHEVLAEETADKKTRAINEIKRIIAENEIEETELEEVFGLFGDKDKKYATDIERLTKQFKEEYKKLFGKDPSDDELKTALKDAGKRDNYQGKFEGESKKSASGQLVKKVTYDDATKPSIFGKTKVTNWE
jgi:hypothetical protein